MILGMLKEATRDQHKNLETVVDVMDSAMSSEAYGALIQKFHRFYTAIEPLIRACEMESVGFDFEKRSKVKLLEQDLRNLKIAPIQNTWTDLPVIDGPARAFGVLYVLEGATLGGQIITRHLRQNLGIDADSGCAFFNSYGDQVGPMWKAFGTAITEFAANNRDNETIIDAAKETFDSFARCFSGETAYQVNARAI